MIPFQIHLHFDFLSLKFETHNLPFKLMCYMIRSYVSKNINKLFFYSMLTQKMI